MFQRQVIVHVTFLKLGEINTLKEQFDADILVRSKWREPLLDTYKPEVNVINAESQRAHGTAVSMVAIGVN